MGTVTKLFGTDPSPQNEAEALVRLNEIYQRQKSENRLTQKKLAGLMGMKEQSAVSQYLLGKVPLNSMAVLNFAQAMNVSPLKIYPELMEPIEKLFATKD